MALSDDVSLSFIVAFSDSTASSSLVIDYCDGIETERITVL